MIASQFVQIILLTVVVALCTITTTNAFVTSNKGLLIKHNTIQQQLITTTVPSTTASSVVLSSNSALHERRWNFNDGEAPWGFKKNAEIWNGRVAQMAFVIVLLQEVIQGKGVIQGIGEGDPINMIIAGAFFVTALGLTGWLALKGNDSNYVS